MTDSWRAERRAAVIAFFIHLGLVLAVLVVCEIDSDPDIIIWWSVFLYIDFPAARFVELLHPSYNVPVAVALILAGGLQWAIVSSLLVLFIRKTIKLLSRG
jgi:hypothetical protein